MFYIICSILYYIGLFVAAFALICGIAIASEAAEYEFYTKKHFTVIDMSEDLNNGSDLVHSSLTRN